MPKTVVGKVESSARLSIGTSTVFAPFSDKIETLSLKLIARSMAPPIDILPIIPKAGFKFLLNTDEMIAAKTAPPIPLCTVEPNKAVT